MSGLGPLISVVMPTYNGASRGFLSQAINSVLRQTYSNFELLIIDDGSSDHTREIIAPFLAPKVRYVYQKNSGVATARNRGIRESHGNFICFLDDDDMWEPEKLARQLAFVSSVADVKAGLFYTALEIMKEDGVRTGIVQSHHAHGEVYKNLLCDNLVDCTSSVMIPRFVLDHVGFFKEYLSYAEDYDLWLRIAKKYHIYSIDEPLVLYREHKNKLSADLEKIETYALYVVFEAMNGLDEVDKMFVYNQVYQHRARYRFWRSEYGQFRRYVWIARAYGSVTLGLRLRVFLSYFPWMIRLLRKVI